MSATHYYGQSLYGRADLLGRIGALRHHSFLNVQLEIQDPVVWEHMVRTGAARIDYSGAYSRLVALICGHQDEAIQAFYLDNLPAAHLERRMPNMERVLRLYLSGNRDDAIAEVDRIVTLDGFPNLGNNPQVAAAIPVLLEYDCGGPSNSTLKEAIFFCAAYLNDAVRCDRWIAIWGDFYPLTAHEKMTIRRLLGQVEEYKTAFHRLIQRPASFYEHRIIAETIARQYAQNRGTPNKAYELGGDDGTWFTHYEAARRLARTANDWCEMARLGFAYFLLMPREDWIHEYITNAERAATISGKSVDWRLCATTCLCTLGDEDRSLRCLMMAASLATSTSEAIACFSLCRWYSLGFQDDLVRILTAAERVCLNGYDIQKCAAAWREVGEVGRAETLAARIGAGGDDEDTDASPVG